MKNIFLSIFLLFALSAFSQNNSYEAPNALIINRQLSKSQYIKSNCLYDPSAPGSRSARALSEKDEDRNIVLFLDVLYPIGWSKDGKFAYAKNGGEEVGGFVINVLDLKNDSVVGWLELNDEKGTDWPISKFWSLQNKEVDDLLSLHKIIQQKEFALKQFPIWIMKKEGNGGNGDEWLYLNTTFNFNIKNNTEKTEKNKLTYSIQSSIKGTKKINEYYYNPTTEWGFSNLGCLQSPYESRIALINAKTVIWSCGGPPATEDIYVFGAHLNAGF